MTRNLFAFYLFFPSRLILSALKNSRWGRKLGRAKLRNEMPSEKLQNKFATSNYSLMPNNMLQSGTCSCGSFRLQNNNGKSHFTGKQNFPQKVIFIFIISTLRTDDSKKGSSKGLNRSRRGCVDCNYHVHINK